MVRGASVRRSFRIVNETSLNLLVPAISVMAGDFLARRLAERYCTATTAERRVRARLSALQGGLAAGGADFGGDRSYGLAGTGTELPLPKPLLSIQVNQIASAQQGTLMVTFDRPSTTSGPGTATLDFRGLGRPYGRVCRGRP